ncbi:MAG: hypothetical protein NTX50_10460 [Candidatus Sumerlaeota bacterium]|nr:hypothetical protein [Candidatus Sumerlaeota bacterium]
MGAAAAMALFVCLVAAPVHAESLAQINSQGNQFLQEKKYDEALERYRAAQLDAPESKELYFNIGSALARENKFEDADKEFAKIDPQPNRDLYAGSRYNVGVMRFREGEQLIGEQKYEDALKKLEAAMQANQDAIRADRQDEDSKYNYEMSKRRYKEVLQKIKEQQEKQQQQKDQKQDQKQDQQKQDQQKQDQQKKDQQQQKQDQEKKDQEKKDQEKKDQEKKDQEKKDQEKQKQEQKDKKDQGNQGEQNQADNKQLQEMTPEDARQLLNTLQDEDKEALKKALRPQGGTLDMKRDW